MARRLARRAAAAAFESALAVVLNLGPTRRTAENTQALIDAAVQHHYAEGRARRKLARKKRFGRKCHLVVPSLELCAMVLRCRSNIEMDPDDKGTTKIVRVTCEKCLAYSGTIIARKSPISG